MKAIDCTDGVYTLIVDAMCDYDSIIKEINLFNEVKAVDPTRVFTPFLLYYTGISWNSADFQALQQISRNVKTHQKEVADCRSNVLHEGDELVKLIEENQEGLFFLYVTDAGKPLYEYGEEEDLTTTVEDIISATTNWQQITKYLLETRLDITICMEITSCAK